MVARMHKGAVAATERPGACVFDSGALKCTSIKYSAEGEEYDAAPRKFFGGLVAVRNKSII